MRRLLPPIPRVKDPIGDSSQGDKMVRPRGHLGTRWPQPSPGRRALLWGLPGGGPRDPGPVRPRLSAHTLPGLQPFAQWDLPPHRWSGRPAGTAGRTVLWPRCRSWGRREAGPRPRGRDGQRRQRVSWGVAALEQSSFPAHSIKGVLPTPRPEGESRPSPHSP